MAKKFSLKDHLFNKTKVWYLASLLAGACGDFQEKKFVNEVMDKLLTLELKDRIRWITGVLSRHLCEDYQTAVVVIIKSLPPPLDPTKSDNDFGDFIFAPLGEYVAVHGCKRELLKFSYQALEEITMRFSMEDAVRAFLRVFPKETLAKCKKWSTHPNYHVRRLVSEGTRPLLPWSGRVPLTSSDTIPLLTVLHADPTAYVTRSVANHLNDIAKREPELVIETLLAWQKLGKQDVGELAWMTKHALRTLIKQGDKEALSLLGYGKVDVKVNDFSLGTDNPKIKAGETLSLQLALTANSDAKILIDYIVHFVKKNGTTAPKVFKWKVLELKAGQSLTIEKRHTLKADATTFTLYPGQHKIEVQINGQKIIAGDFTLH